MLFSGVHTVTQANKNTEIICFCFQTVGGNPYVSVSTCPPVNGIVTHKGGKSDGMTDFRHRQANGDSGRWQGVMGDGCARCRKNTEVIQLFQSWRKQRITSENFLVCFEQVKQWYLESFESVEAFQGRWIFGGDDTITKIADKTLLPYFASRWPLDRKRRLFQSTWHLTGFSKLSW